MCFWKRSWISDSPIHLIRGLPLTKNQYVAAVLMDHSNAFDCLPHDILLDKLSAYGMSTDSVFLLESYYLIGNNKLKLIVS